MKLSSSVSCSPGHQSGKPGTTLEPPTYAQGLALQQQGEFEKAQAIYEQVLAIQPRHFDTLHMLGVIAIKTRRFDQALQWIDRSLEVDPRSVVAWNNRGNVFKAVQQPQLALDCYDKAIELNKAYAEAYYNRAAALKDLQRVDDAIASYDKAIALKAGFAEAYYNRGNLFRERRLPETAIENYDKAIALNPDLPGVHLNLGMCFLQLGRLTAGWEKYEWRRDEMPARNFAQPLWLGTPSLQGKTILLHSEQGLGDTLQFCRYVPQVHALGARVVLEVQAPLMGLMTSLKGVSHVVARGAELPPSDFHCPLLSLPLVCGTTLDTVPSANGYLATPAGKVGGWKDRLGPKAAPRVGLVWSGNAGHKNDSSRSIALATLIKFLPSGLDYVSLQKEVREADRSVLQHADIAHFGEEIRDFSDTAALCELMDVIVSVDTSVAHLAGALGKPVWILLPFNPDWRWLLERADTPWYGSASLYRQESMGDWSALLDQLGTDLKQMRF